MTGRTVVFLSHDDAAALRLAGACALTAAASGERVDVFLLGPAVAAAVEAHGDPDHAGALLHQARGAGSCRLLACSAGLVESGLQPADAEAAVDAVIGWPTVLAWSSGVTARFFF